MKLGIIGTGKIVEEALPVLQANEKIQLFGICAVSNKEKAHMLARAYNINKVYDHYEEMITSDDIDFVYVAVVNSAHFAYALKALESHKHVILEKPFTTCYRDATTLIHAATQRGAYLFDATTLFFTPTYEFILKSLPLIGQPCIVNANYSQRSSRYDRYIQGDIAPAFSTELEGGALLDINIYNISLTVGLFGLPTSATYFARKGYNGIDTSGVAVLSYPSLVATCVGTKDSDSPAYAYIQGDRGRIEVEGRPSELRKVRLVTTDGVKEMMLDTRHRMSYEFETIASIYHGHRYAEMTRRLDTTRQVIQTLDMLNAQKRI